MLLGWGRRGCEILYGATDLAEEIGALDVDAVAPVKVLLRCAFQVL